MSGYSQRWMSLALSVAVVGLVWMVVLPWIGSRPSVRARMDELSRQGIDPAAMYYTDLEVMPRLEMNIAAIRRAHPEAFWIGAGRPGQNVGKPQAQVHFARPR